MSACTGRVKAAVTTMPSPAAQEEVVTMDAAAATRAPVSASIVQKAAEDSQTCAHP